MLKGQPRSEPFAWVLRGVYIGLPPGGTMVIRPGTGPAVCDCARRLPRRLLEHAGWWVPPSAGSLVDRQAPLSRALSVAGYCCSILVTKALPRWAWLQFRRPAGDCCSLTASCLLNGASPSRGWQADCGEPALSWADWGRPGRLRVSLCLKGPTARGPHWQPVVDDIRVNVATVPHRTGHGHPVWRTVPGMLRDSGVAGFTVATPRHIAVMWMQTSRVRS